MTTFSYQGNCPTCQLRNVLYVDLPGPAATHSWQCTNDGTTFNLAFSPNVPDPASEEKFSIPPWPFPYRGHAE